MLKVLATDGLSPRGLEILEAAEGIDLDVQATPEPEALKKMLNRYQVIIIRSATKLTADILDAAPDLQLAIRAGVGVDNIDVARATERGILVANTPQGNAATTAEHAFSLITSLARHVPQANAALHDGRWDKKKFMGTELRGKTLGIVGLGNIGATVARIGKGYQMRVLASDPFLTAETAERHGVERVELSELIERSDVITIHCPFTEATRGLIGAGEFERMKETALVVNCARGGIVDEEALAEACKAGRIRGAAVDVFTTEPVPADNPLLGVPNIIVTPHLGASTKEAQVSVAIEAGELVLEYAKSGSVRSAINSSIRLGDLSALTRDSVKLARSLGDLLGQLLEGAPRQLAVEIFGEENAGHRELLTLSAAETFLRAMHAEGRINHVNVKQHAEMRNLELVGSVVTSTGAAMDGYSNWLRVRMTARDENGRDVVHTAAGSVLQSGTFRITEIDGYPFDLVPAGRLLLVRNRDQPGVIGRIGTLLGEHGVNISRMAVNTAPDNPDALGVYTIDQAVSDDIIRELAGWDKISEVRQVELRSGKPSA